MGFLLDKCTVSSHNDEMLKFSCGDKDLDVFFLRDAIKYKRQLLGKTGGKGIGTELISFIKQWMLDPSNKTACRYLTVDAYNNVTTLKFYETNGFKTIFSSETQEKEYVGLPLEKELKTRLMYFDLMLLK